MKTDLEAKRAMLREQTDLYIKQKADEIEASINPQKGYVTVATCDHSNWDRKLHHHFSKIAIELRNRGYSVSCSVNWGVTDWVIKIN